VVAFVTCRFSTKDRIDKNGNSRKQVYFVFILF
jgi:hypothetical protein